ncbi:hypothetical protein QOZ80_9BG0713800 [Eleusine coracana subsp. coracana]|nr:hypothetical protein QOZ80_9BG0713800 [Eleusine coracana subsp. coracana]
MGDVAKKIKRMETELADVPPRLNENNHEEILVRLPVKDVIRSGIICKAWQRITSDGSFLTDHMHRQPVEVLLYRYVSCELPRHEWPLRGRWVSDVVLDAILISDDVEKRRSVIRYRQHYNGGLFLLAVCDGVLLFKNADGVVYIMCNPTTRKWSNLPLVHYPSEPPRPANIMLDDSEYAFYFHHPSSEFRLLCRQNSEVNRQWCILSTGNMEPRNIDSEDAWDAGITPLVPCLRKTVTTPLALHGNLHWPPHQGSIAGRTRMVVFDILSETFTQMEGPPITTGNLLMKLFIMDGLLVGADFGQERHIDLWFLENYGARWELRHQVAAPWWTSSCERPLIPWDLLGMVAVGDGDGNVMLGHHQGLVVYNVGKKTMKTINSVETSENNIVVVSRHVFKVNLVQHPYFSSRSTTDMPLIQF